MKIVINSCYGGFGLSPKALKMYAELNGKKCYFFKDNITNKGEPIELEEAEKTLFHSAYTVPNPKDYRIDERGKDGTYKESNKRAEEIGLSSGDIKRNDKNLIKVVEALKGDASGKCGKLTIVEIPDDVKWQIEEYDGFEHVAEQHRTWN